jgi:hypothetical protein
MVNPGNAISAQGLGDCTAEARRARSKEFLIKKYSELCDLCTTIVDSLRGSRKLSGIWNIRTQGIDSRQGAKHAKFGGKR